METCAVSEGDLFAVESALALTCRHRELAAKLDPCSSKKKGVGFE